MIYKEKNWVLIYIQANKWKTNIIDVFNDVLQS